MQRGVKIIILEKIESRYKQKDKKMILYNIKII